MSTIRRLFRHSAPWPVAWLLAALAGVWAGVWAAGAVAAPRPAPAVTECGDPFVNGVGPWDYTNGIDRTDAGRIPLVESYHFTPVVESLVSGSTNENAMGDLDYTLRAIPNHHRALNAVARYDLERGGVPPQWRPAECWFERALRFRPNDGVVWMIYGNYKSRKKQTDAALDAYQKARELMPGNVEVDYDLGLLYVQLGQYDKALERARAAYAADFPLKGLRNKLAEKGYIVETRVAAPPAPPAADAAAGTPQP